MKIKFNESEFSANMNDFTYCDKSEVNIKLLLHYSAPLVFGMISIITSLCLLPFAFFVNVLSSALAELDGGIPSNYLLIFLSAGILFTCISIGASVCSMVFFSKSKKRNPDVIGIILSIFSIIVCTISLTIGIVSVVI